jgi:hypothetical protein
MNGPDEPDPPVACTLPHFQRADLEGDNDVDMGDFGLLQQALDGP